MITTNSTSTKKYILTRDADGVYFLWLPESEPLIKDQGGQWFGTNLPSPVAGVMTSLPTVLQFLGTIPIDLDIGPGYKVDIEVTKLTKISAKHTGEATI